MTKTDTRQSKVPKLRFPGFDDEWEEKRLGDVGEFLKGKGISKSEISQSGRNECIRYGELYTNYKETIKTIISRTDVSKKDSVVSHYGDILIPSSGETAYDIATVSCVLEDNIILGGDLNIIRLNRNYNDGIFFAYLLKNSKRLEIANLAQGNSVVHLYNSQLKNLVLSLPSLPEQQKIASFLESVDKWIENLRSQKQNLEEYKKGMMQKIFSQEIRFKIKNENGELVEPPEWEEKNGNDLFENISDKKHNSDLPILAITQDLGAIPRDHIDFKISVTEKSIDSYKVVRKGDYIISLRSFQGGIEYSNYDGICSPAYIILRAFMPLSSEFYKYYFKTPNYIKRLTKHLEGIRDGKMISFKFFSDTVIPYPTLLEQQKIADFLSSLDNLIESKQTQIFKAEEWKKGLMQGLFV